MIHKIIDSANSAEMADMEAFVSNHKSSHFLQSPQWRSVKSRWGWRGVIALDSRQRILGVLSVLIRPLPLGLSILYAPRGPVCDRNDPAVMAELLQGAKEIAKARRAILLYMDPDELDTNTGFRAWMKGYGFTEQSSRGFGNIQPQYVFRLNLQDRNEEEIFKAFSVKTRYNIRLASRHHVEIQRFSGGNAIPEDAIAAFSRLMEITGQRDHFLVRDRAYFERLLNAFGSQSVLFLASVDGEPAAGTIGIFYGHKAWYLYGASANTHRNAMPNYLLQWEIIRQAIHRGCQFYDFRGVPGDLSEDNPLYGLYRFKKGFGGEYTKFSGLFIYPFKPILSRIFLTRYAIAMKH